MRPPRDLLTRLVEAGLLPTDDQDLRLKKIALTLVHLFIGPAAFVWGATYFLLGNFLSGSIPMSYAVVSGLGLAYFFRTKRMGFLQHSQRILVLLLPFLLMWSLGGFAASSMVMIWAIVTPVAALMFFDRQRTTGWFLAYFALIVVSVLIDGIVSKRMTPLPPLTQKVFYLLNMGCASAGLFLLGSHAVEEELRGIEGSKSEPRGNSTTRRARPTGMNHMLNNVLDTIPVKIFWKDRNLRYLGCNQLFADDAGKALPLDAIGRDDFDMSWRESAERYRRDDLDVIESGQSKLKFEEPQAHSDGVTTCLRTTKIPLCNELGHVYGVLGTHEDITHAKSIEQELIVSKESAETGSSAKSTFLANMSHKIRTPLNSITGMANLIRRSGLEPLQEQQMDKLELASRHLPGIINAVLERSNFEAGKFALEEAEISDNGLLGTIVSRVQSRAQAKHLQLTTRTEPLPPHLLGDLTRLQQALLNCATKAVKFTERGHITLSVRCVEEDARSAMLRFEIEDTGSGLHRIRCHGCSAPPSRRTTAPRVSTAAPVSGWPSPATSPD